MATSVLGVVSHPCLTFYSSRANSFLGTSRPRQPYSSANRSPLLSRNRTCSTRIVRRRLHCNAEIESSESRGTHPDTILNCVSKDAEVPLRTRTLTNRLCSLSMCIPSPTLFSRAPLSAGFCVRSGRHGPRFGGPETPRHRAHSRSFAMSHASAPADRRN